MKFTSTLLAIALASSASAALLNARPRQDIPTTLPIDPSFSSSSADVTIPGTEDVSLTDTVITPSDTIDLPTISDSFTVTTPTVTLPTSSLPTSRTGVTVSVPSVTPPTTPGDGAATTRAGVFVAGAAALIAIFA